MAGGGTVDLRRICHREVLPFTAMVAVECTNVGLTTLFKLATLHGMSRHVFLAYACGVAALILLPSPFLSCRSRVLPPMNFHLLLKIFFLGVIGYSKQIMKYTGINYASPTLASAMSNLAPAFTFVLAVFFRMEKVVLSSRCSQAKIVGTIVSIIGALILTLYQGPTIIASDTMSSISLHHHHSFQSSQRNWMLGSLFLAVHYFLEPVWYIGQTQVMKEYPAELTVVFFYNSFLSIIAGVVGFLVEPDPSQWALKPNVALASILCSGILVFGLSTVVYTWALHLRGPVYVAIFNPLSIAIAAAMGIVILGDTLYLGSIIGAIIISIGFYTVIWGIAKDELAEPDAAQTGDLESIASQEQPLLQSYAGSKR